MRQPLITMQAFACVLVSLILEVNGQNGTQTGGGSSDAGGGSSNTSTIVITSLVVSIVLLIVIGLAVLMWVRACYKPGRGYNDKRRRTWDWKASLRHVNSTDKLLMVGTMETDDKRKSLGHGFGSIDSKDGALWQSNENISRGSMEDLVSSQAYVHTVNYSEIDNDFQALKLDETLFENPTSRSRSEAQLTNVTFAVPGLQVKAKKLDDLSTAYDEKLVDFYDLHTPRSSPRRNMNKAFCSTGDLSNEPSPSLSGRKLIAASEQTESPLINQEAVLVTADVEVNTEQISDGGNENYPPDFGSHDATTVDPVNAPTKEPPLVQENNASCLSEESLRERLTDTPGSGAEQNGVEVNTEQISNDGNEKHPPDFGSHDVNPVNAPTKEPHLAQEDNTSEESLRERLTGTPDSGVILNEEASSIVSQDQLAKADSVSDGMTSSTTVDHDTSSSAHSSTHHIVATNSTNHIATEIPAIVVQQPDCETSWETVVNRKQRYLQMVELSATPKTLRLKDRSTQKKKSWTQSETDSDYEGEEAILLSSSQPMLDLTGPEDPQPAMRNTTDASSSDSETEELHEPLQSTKLSARNSATLASYTNPLLSDSSDDESEMVQPTMAIVYRSPVKNAAEHVREYRASHPPMKRTMQNEYVATSTGQHSKKRRHRPKLKSIQEEGGNNTYHMRTI